MGTLRTYVYLSEDNGEWLVHVDVGSVQVLTARFATKNYAVDYARMFYNEYQLSEEIKSHKENNK